jgi:hypothetical protein
MTKVRVGSDGTRYGEVPNADMDTVFVIASTIDLNIFFIHILHRVGVESCKVQL